MELWKHNSGGNHKVIAQTFFKVNDLVCQIKKFQFESYKGKKLDTFLVVNHFMTEQIYDFLDFLYGGMNMTMVVGVDFTASNKDPEDYNSLHYLNMNQMNLY